MAMSKEVTTLDELLEELVNFVVVKVDNDKKRSVLPEFLASDFFLKSREQINALKQNEQLMTKSHKTKGELTEGLDSDSKKVVEGSYEFFIEYLEAEEKNSRKSSKKKKKQNPSIAAIFSNLEYIGMHDTRAKSFPSAFSRASFETPS